MPPRILAALVAALSLLPAAALAQANDDWEGFKSGSAPKPAPAPAPAPAPSPAPAFTPSPAKAPTAAALPASPPVAAATGETKLVSTKESMLGDEAEHAPSTLHNAASDPRNVRDAAGEGGAVGVLHVSSAHFGAKNILHLSANAEYFRSSNFPVLQATDTRSAGIFALGYTFTPWLQAYASYTVAANTNNRSSPHLIQDQGDAAFGASVGTEVARGLSLGLDARALLSPGTGNQDLSRSVFGFFPRGMLTYDLHALSPSLPLRAHVNAGVLFDKTSSFANGQSLTAAEEFALQTNRYNRVALGGALEVPLTAVTPFVEYNAAIPVGTRPLVAPDNTATTVGASMAQTLGLGVRVTAIQDITLNAAVDLGLARTVAYGIPATPPYNLLFGATYAIDPFGSTRTKVVDRTFERTLATAAPQPPTGRVEGTVVDSATGKPLPNVVVAFADQPPVATDAARGRFLTYELPPGQVKLTASLPGYQSATADAVVEAGKVSAVQLSLTPAVAAAAAVPEKAGSLTVNVLARRKKVPGATVTLSGGSGTLPAVAANGEAVKLPIGHYTVAVAADGFTGQSREVDIAQDKKAVLRFDLKPAAPEATATPTAPRKQLVVIVKNKLVIKQQVHFATNKAIILRDSYALLDQVADAIKTNALKKVLVEGHTDNQGSKELNLKLSADRANAVRSYLVKKGIAADVLESKGFGDTKPIAPNMTAKGREANRRVEFTIEEK